MPSHHLVLPSPMISEQNTGLRLRPSRRDPGPLAGVPGALCSAPLLPGQHEVTPASWLRDPLPLSTRTHAPVGRTPGVQPTLQGKQAACHAPTAWSPVSGQPRWPGTLRVGDPDSLEPCESAVWGHQTCGLISPGLVHRAQDMSRSSAGSRLCPPCVAILPEPVLPPKQL